MRIGQLKNILSDISKENPNAIVNVVQINKRTKAISRPRDIIDVKEAFGFDQKYINIICEKK
jgi:hypothetical protein